MGGEREVRGEMARVSDNPFGLAGYSSSTYGDRFADVYDDWYSDLGDADFIDAIIRSLPTTECDILELGVGTGRLLDALAHRRAPLNDRMVGVDTSGAMLERATARPRLSRVTLNIGDFSQSLPQGPFDVVFCGYNTFFNLPDEAAMSRTLSLVASVLRPDGLFAIDVVVTRGDAADDVSLREITADRVVLSVSRHDPDHGRIIGQFVEFTNGSPVVLRPWSVRYVSPGALDDLARHAGLLLVERSADGRGAPFSEDSARHVSVYRRA